MRAIAVGLALLLAPCAASSFTVEYLAPNVSIAYEFAEAEFPLPPTSIAGRPVLGWLDAAGPSNPDNEWSWSGDVLGYEPGLYTMLYPYTAGSYITATTAVPSVCVAFAAGCDENDGRGQFYVDGNLIAQVDYYSTPPVFVVFVVETLPLAQHELRLTSLGGAVAVFGGAALGPVPEPASLAALLCGLGALPLLRRRIPGQISG